MAWVTLWSHHNYYEKRNLVIFRTSYRELGQHLKLVKEGNLFEKNAPQVLPLPIQTHSKPSVLHQNKALCNL